MDLLIVTGQGPVAIDQPWLCGSAEDGKLEMALTG